MLDGLEGVAAGSGEGFDRAELDQLLSSLGKRMFLLHNVHEKRPALFQTRWTMSYLRGPMGRDEIRRLSPRLARATRRARLRPGRSRSPASSRAIAAHRCVCCVCACAAASTASAPSVLRPGARDSAAPVLDPAIRQFFAPARRATSSCLRPWSAWPASPTATPSSAWTRPATSRWSRRSPMARWRSTGSTPSPPTSQWTSCGTTPPAGCGLWPLAGRGRQAEELRGVGEGLRALGRPVAVDRGAPQRRAPS